MFFRIRFYPESLVASSFAKFYPSTRLRVVTLPGRAASRHLMALEGNASQNLCFVLVLVLALTMLLFLMNCILQTVLRLVDTEHEEENNTMHTFNEHH
jgi:hypothetical protein